MKAAVKFTGVVNGKEKVFNEGDPITAKEAEEMGLDGKPDLVAKGNGKADKAATDDKE